MVAHVISHRAVIIPLHLEIHNHALFTVATHPHFTQAFSPPHQTVEHTPKPESIPGPTPFVAPEADDSSWQSRWPLGTIDPLCLLHRRWRAPLSCSFLSPPSIGTSLSLYDCMLHIFCVFLMYVCVLIRWVC